MGNYLEMADIRHILALLELGWSQRRIARETGVNRETVARYDPRHKSKPATVPTGSTGTKPARVPTGSTSVCEPYRSLIEASLRRGLSAQRIWQDLREEYNFNAGYCAVKRFVHKLKRGHREVVAVLEHLPGAEAQIDFFQGVAHSRSQQWTPASSLDFPHDTRLQWSQIRRKQALPKTFHLSYLPSKCLKGQCRPMAATSTA